MGSNPASRVTVQPSCLVWVALYKYEGLFVASSVNQDAVISSDSLCLLGMLTQKRAYLLTHSSIGELSFNLNPGTLLNSEQAHNDYCKWCILCYLCYNTNNRFRLVLLVYRILDYKQSALPYLTLVEETLRHFQLRRVLLSLIAWMYTWRE